MKESLSVVRQLITTIVVVEIVIVTIEMVLITLLWIDLTGLEQSPIHGPHHRRRTRPPAPQLRRDTIVKMKQGTYQQHLRTPTRGDRPTKVVQRKNLNQDLLLGVPPVDRPPDHDLDQVRRLQLLQRHGIQVQARKNAQWQLELKIYHHVLLIHL